MEEPVFVKCEPAWTEDMEEANDFTSVRVKEEIFREEQILDEQFEFIKEENNSEDFALSTEGPVDSSDGSCQTLNSRTHIAYQIQTATEEVTDPSSVCGQKFLQDQCVNADVLTPSVRRMRYVCKICSISFSEKSLIKEHVLIHSTMYHCNVCEKSFAKKSYLERHILNHSTEKCFSCDVCNRKYKRIDALKIHSSLHTGVLPYSCDVCNRKFRRTDTLKRHFSIHTGVRPYSCDVCNKEFHIRNSLSEHFKTHSGEKQHFCSICKKGFVRKFHVQQHMIVHSEKNVVRL